MFPITMSITVSTPAELDRLVAAVGGAPAGNAPKEPAKPAAPAASASTAAPAAAPDKKGENSGGAQASNDTKYTLDNAKELTKKLVGTLGRDETVKLLTKYGVDIVAKLTAEQVAPFCTDAEKLLAG